MGISAFLVPGMAKETEEVELRLVEEDTESDVRPVEHDAGDLEDMEPVRLGVERSPDQLDGAGDGLKTRSKDPDARMLDQIEIYAPEEPWETQAVLKPGFPWVWVGVIACLFVVAILWSLVNVKRGGAQQRVIAEDTLSILEKDAQERMDAVLLVGALEGVVRDFFGSGSVEEMLRHVRHPERVAPLMERYYGNGGPTPLRVEKIFPLEPITIDKRANFWMVPCDLGGSSRKVLVLESGSDNQVKVDWESFVCYQPMDWDEFAVTRPDGYTGDFRVYVQRDNFHSHEFADSETFDSYRLTALNGEETLYGYVSRDSAHAPLIAKLAAGHQGKPTPMILRLHLPEGLDSPRGLVVAELVSPRWVYVEDPGIK
jgi:hypothetical protein